MEIYNSHEVFLFNYADGYCILWMIKLFEEYFKMKKFSIESFTQFQAQIGGRLKYGHFEMIRFVMGKKLPSSCFAVYRVDPPWQPVTKKVSSRNFKQIDLTRGS